MDAVNRLLFSIIFAQPLPPDFDQELSSELYKTPSRTLVDSFALRQMLIVWLNRTPEMEEDVRAEILQLLQGLINESLKKGEEIVVPA